MTEVEGTHPSKGVGERGILFHDGEGNPPRDTAGWRAGMTLAALDALKEADIQIGGLRKGLLRQAFGTTQVAHVRPDITEDRADAGRVALHVGVRTPMFASE